VIPQALAALTLDNSITETKWTFDTGALKHMTGMQGMLTNIHKYSGSDSVIIGDGSFIPITGIGDSCIKQKDKTLPLYDVLLVPNIKKNLLSISQLTSQFPVNCEFFNVDFCVKKRKTRHPLITRKKKGVLYVLSNAPEAHFSYRFKSGTANIWHQRLGHPQASVVLMYQVVNFSFLVMFLTRLFFRLNLLQFLLLPHMSLIYLILGYLFLTLLYKQVPSHKGLHQ
jgi:hypothetical protein